MTDTIKKIVLTDAIDYQDGTIVSKQILKKPNGNVTLFAFDKGEQLSEHTSPYEALVNIIDGEMEIRIDGNPYTVMTGELIVLPANVSHGLTATARAKMLLTMIK